MPSHAEIDHLAGLKTTLWLCAFLVVCLGPGIARGHNDSEDEHDEASAERLAKPFSDAGNRLGAPVSAPSTSSTSAAPPAPASNVNINPRLEIDTTHPTKSIQVRLANGTSPPRGPPCTIGTTFPMRMLDPAAVARKRGSGVVVVQSWV
ncbi:hypothetical protein DFH08DRAFT_967472 [Mycena albidolilacea]|uniref:Secreted protein n=1 Tax=Mycena albidolilacea TaxID=1033008 RepID=A0AAD7EJY5_9AGAR|nr:hypothetical protein DFH08DRAFT_967472 [Mycena albidolilacea]